MSNEFGDFVGVQIGSIMVSATDIQFAQVCVGFTDDFNQILGYFS